MERWNMKRAHAYRLIESAEVMSPLGDKSAITSERQARELARVEPERRQEVVERAVEAKANAPAILPRLRAASRRQPL
jgi:hypothetical protein